MPSDNASEKFQEWYASLKRYKQNDGPARGTVAAALVVLERLREDFDLDIAAHTAKGGTQIKGVAATAVQRVLSRYGESRPFLKEGGRTNRGARSEIADLLDALRRTHLRHHEADIRTRKLDSFQKFLVGEASRMMNRESLSIVYSPELTAWSIVRNLLELADVNRKRGPVAEYLVGAKLALRFPKLSIRNSSYSAADEQVGEQGDFYVGNTAFHVTVAYAPALLAKCLANLEAGFRVYLLVPEDVADKVRYEVENRVQGRITVGSIEGFVSQNIEELSCFDGNKLKHGLRRLLEMYNERVGEVETDASLRISIPQNLL